MQTTIRQSTNVAPTIIKFRPTRRRDHKIFAQMLGAQWELGRCSPSGSNSIYGYIYLCEILSHTDILITATDALGAILGFAGVEIKLESGSAQQKTAAPTRARLRKWHFKRKFDCLIARVPNPAALAEYYRAYDYCPAELAQMFDGELTILIIDEKHRSHGLGAALFTEICAHARSANITALCIPTDDSCGVAFYERNNCTRVYETQIQNGERPAETAYIFERKL